MYNSVTSSSSVSSYSSSMDDQSTFKETLHISPHIAAHKSVPMTSVPTSVLPSSTYVNLSAAVPASSGVLAPTSTPEVMTYKVISAATSNSNSSFQEFAPISSNSRLLSSNYVTLAASKDRSNQLPAMMSNSVKTTLTNLSRVTPEDLSASSDTTKLTTSSVLSTDLSYNGNQSKVPQNVYTLASQVPASLLNSAVDRNTAYFRSPDSPNLTGQPQAILVSGLVACGDSNIESVCHPTTLAALPSSSIMGEVLGLVNENRIKKEDDSISVRPSVMQQSHLLPVQQHQLQQTATLPPQQRDLMRQALQAVVAPKSSDQELIEYSYTAGDIQDLLLIANGTGQQALRQTTGTSSGTFQLPHLGGSVSSLTPAPSSANTTGASIAGVNVIDSSGASVIMMPSGASSHLPSELLSGGGSSLLAGHIIQGNVDNATGIIMASTNPGQSSLDGISLHGLSPGTVFSMDINTAAANVNMHNLPASDDCIMPDNLPAPSSAEKDKKNKTPKASEGDMTVKRLKLAQVMREKRANETEEQKSRRRLREAERMRRRRALESDDQKATRRQEAAERARQRRATMNDNERFLDRRKAAERMRLRRLNEGDQQKSARRMRAAERMRRRRAEETPDQRALRRKNLAIMMKTRRRKKQQENVLVHGVESQNYSDNSENSYKEAMGRPLDDLTSDIDNVKAQDLSSSMALHSQESVHSGMAADLLLKADHQDYGGRELLSTTSDVRYTTTAAAHDNTHRKMIIMDGADTVASKLLGTDESLESHLVTQSSTIHPRRSIVSLPHADNTRLDTSSHLTRMPHLATSSSQQFISSADLLHYVPSSSSPNSHYSDIVTSAPLSSISHVPVLRSRTNIDSYSIKSSDHPSEPSNIVYTTQGSLPTMLSSSRFVEAHNLSGSVTELTAVDSTHAEPSNFSKLIPTPDALGKNLPVSVSNSNIVNNVSNSPTNNILNNHRSILRIQSSSSPSSSAFNISNYSITDDLSDISHETFRMSTPKASGSLPVLMPPSRTNTRSSNSNSHQQLASKSSGFVTASRSVADYTESQPMFVISSVASLSPTSRGASSSHSRVATSSCADNSTTGVAHSSVISTTSGLTTIVLNQSAATQRTLAS